MFHHLLHTLEHSGLITLFVLSMMLIIDLVNVKTNGQWQQKLHKARFGQHLLGAILGALPGCLGSFTVVSMYMHRILRIGAVVTTMVATSGDEAFVMFALFPKEALILTGVLMVVGIITGVITDLIMARSHVDEENCCETRFEVHTPHSKEGLSLRNVRGKLRDAPLPFMALLIIGSAALGLMVYRLFRGGPSIQNITYITVLAVLLVVTLFATSHFVRHHLWEHIVKKHAPKILLWTFGSLLIIVLLKHYSMESLVRSSPWVMLLLAALIGLIPDSGPHLFFVMLFFAGVTPFSVLLASSISQDGHGAIPLLAHSRKDFFLVKGINLVAALTFGALLMLLGL